MQITPWFIFKLSALDLYGYVDNPSSQYKRKKRNTNALIDTSAKVERLNSQLGGSHTNPSTMGSSTGNVISHTTQGTSGFSTGGGLISPGEANNAAPASTGVKEGSKCEQSGSDLSTHIAENLLQVNVFFQSLNVQTITESPKYEVKNIPRPLN